MSCVKEVLDERSILPDHAPAASGGDASGDVVLASAHCTYTPLDPLRGLGLQNGAQMCAPRQQVPSSARSPPTWLVVRGPIPHLTYNKHTYMQCTCFCALQGDVLDQHHLTQARKGSAVASALLALQRYLGDLPLRLAIKVYLARVEPILTYGCEVGIALTKPARDALEKVQLMFFRRVLGYSTRSMRAIIFSETGILPILHRRLILALRFYKRMLDLPADTIAAHAFRNALALYAAGRPGCIGKLTSPLACVASSLSRFTSTSCSP